jgi:ribosomal protein S18 acetylase RimI-like enzyme
VIQVRQARLPADAPAIAAIDTAFSTSTVYDVQVTDSGFALSARRLETPLIKRFPLDDLEDPKRPWSHGFVAEDDAACVGFAAAEFESWNGRLILWHLYVQAAARGRGTARILVDRVDSLGRELGARHIWLETSNLNGPGIAAYRALGFRLSGLDLTLYDGTPAQGEIALFFERQIG